VTRVIKDLKEIEEKKEIPDLLEQQVRRDQKATKVIQEKRVPLVAKARKEKRAIKEILD
jgi:hypothetical protein